MAKISKNIKKILIGHKVDYFLRFSGARLAKQNVGALCGY